MQPCEKPAKQTDIQNVLISSLRAPKVVKTLEAIQQVELIQSIARSNLWAGKQTSTWRTATWCGRSRSAAYTFVFNSYPCVCSGRATMAHVNTDVHSIVHCGRWAALLKFQIKSANSELRLVLLATRFDSSKLASRDVRCRTPRPTRAQTMGASLCIL